MIEPPMDIFNVLLMDRHIDPIIYSFKDRVEAIKFAAERAEKERRGDAVLEVEDEEYEDDIWIWYCCYSSEGDSIGVMKGKLQ
jgi:hypothetical protein